LSSFENAQGIIIPQLVEHADAIARRKERAVPYFEFDPREE